MRSHHQLKAPQVLIDHIETPYEATFWGQKCRCEPAMVRAVLGDGGKLAFITPLMTRPNHYAILVHSEWTEEDLGDRSELILRTIEDSFGNRDDQVEDDAVADGSADEVGLKWPALHDGGHSWGFITDVPEHIMQAAREDIARQMREQKALFIGDIRITPGALLKHPEFGLVQARHNDELGWHFCRRGVMHDFRPGDSGYSTDFYGVEPTVISPEEGPRFEFSGIYRRMSTPAEQPTAAPRKWARPR